MEINNVAKAENILGNKKKLPVRLAHNRIVLLA
jgi:hypothetical protein